MACVEDVVIGVVTDKLGDEYRVDLRSSRQEPSVQRRAGAARNLGRDWQHGWQLQLEVKLSKLGSRRWAAPAGPPE